MRTGISKALSIYGQVTYGSAVEYSSPAELLNLLFDGLTDSLVDAMRHLREKNFTAKGAAVSKAQNILATLRETLDFDAGGELAQHLDELYAYCFKTLGTAHCNNDQAALQEVHEILSSLRAAWQQAAQLTAMQAPAARRAFA